jgi:WD40 repeat protein
VNRMKFLLPNMFCTGDDDGVIKLWDPRKPQEIRRYTHHFDFISDFLWLGDKMQLVSTSADGALSVMDVRGKKSEPLSRSEDQEDELLSIVAVRNGTKDGVTVSTEFLAIHNPLMHSALYHPHIPLPTPQFLRDRQMVCCVLYSYFLPNSSVSLPTMGRSPSKGLQSTKTVREDGWAVRDMKIRLR